MEFKMDSIKSAERGEYISGFLKDNGVESESNLVINVTKEQLRKIDEDFYYRNKVEGKEFEPSEKDVIAKFGNFNIIFSAD